MVQVGCFSLLIINFVDLSLVAWASMSGKSSSSSGDSVVPISVKRARPKRTMSDEDVWDYSNAKIIGIYIY